MLMVDVLGGEQGGFSSKMWERLPVPTRADLNAAACRIRSCECTSYIMTATHEFERCQSQNGNIFSYVNS